MPTLAALRCFDLCCVELGLGFDNNIFLLTISSRINLAELHAPGAIFSCTMNCYSLFYEHLLIILNYVLTVLIVTTLFKKGLYKPWLSFAQLRSAVILRLIFGLD